MKLLERLLGYIDAKIEDCLSRDPIPQEIKAWDEMKRYLIELEKDLNEVLFFVKMVVLMHLLA